MARKKKSKHTRWRNNVIKHCLARDGSDCWLCGEPLGNDISIDHVIPKSDGGPKKSKDNIKLAHTPCNNHRYNPTHELQMMAMKLAREDKYFFNRQVGAEIGRGDFMSFKFPDAFEEYLTALV